MQVGQALGLPPVLPAGCMPQPRPAARLPGQACLLCPQRPHARPWPESVLVVCQLPAPLSSLPARPRWAPSECVLRNATPALPAGALPSPTLAGRDGRPSECVLYYAKRDVPHLLNVIRMGKKSKAAFQREVELVDQVGNILLFNTNRIHFLFDRLLRMGGRAGGVPASLLPLVGLELPPPTLQPSGTRLPPPPRPRALRCARTVKTASAAATPS